MPGHQPSTEKHKLEPKFAGPCSGAMLQILVEKKINFNFYNLLQKKFNKNTKKSFTIVNINYTFIYN